MAGTVNFYLKKPDQSGLSLIYLQFKFQGNRLVVSTGQSISKKDWNAKKQRVKRNDQTTADGKYSLNDLLTNLAAECERAYHEQLKDGKLSVIGLKTHLGAFLLGKSPESSGQDIWNLIDRFIAGEIRHRNSSKSPNTLKGYKSTRNHLESFERDKKYRLSFESFNLDFYYRFKSYLEQRGLVANSIGKHIKNIKVFLREAADMDLTENLSFGKRKFAVLKEETFATALTNEEIGKLYKTDLSNNPRLEQVRDLFVFGCFVGLRYSDYSDIRPENIKQTNGEAYIDIRAKKTGQRVVIPCNPIVMEIFRKYKQMPNMLPKSISNQKFNAYIKEVCRIAGLDETGRLEGSPEMELWETVSTHTARRSFATNLYNEGFPIIDLMRITGHKTEKSFRSYIKVTETDAAQRLSKHNKQKNWSEFLLRVAS